MDAGPGYENLRTFGMMPLVQVVWLGVSAGLFVIWVSMLCRLMVALPRPDGTSRRDMPRLHNCPVAAAFLGRVAEMTAALVTLAGVGLLLWPP